MTIATKMPGGPAVIERLMAKLAYTLTEAQAAMLWQECRVWMLEQGFQDSVAEVECSPDGSLDTWPRNDVMEALAKVFTGLSWPMNGTPAAERETFTRLLLTELAKRDYSPA